MNMRNFLGGAMVALSLVAAGSASAQESVEDIPQMWERYDALFEQQEAALAQVDETTPGTTRGDRVRREAIDVSLELRALMQYLVVNDRTLVDSELIGAWDTLLTTEQVIGSLYVETQQCDLGEAMLSGVVNHPEAQSRDLLRERAGDRLEEARACVAAQEAAAAVVVETGTEMEPETPLLVEQPEPVESGRGFRAGHGVLIAGGALLAGYAGLELASAGNVNEYNELGDSCSVGCSATDASRYSELEDSLKPRRTTAIILLASSVATLGVGTVMLVTDRPDRPATTLNFAPFGSRHSAGMVVTLRR
jgi:hypothetical protein